MAVLGTITIGQSPRPDLIPELKAVLGESISVIEGGALDGLTLDEVKAFAPSPGDYVLITRMSDGTAVKIAEKHILPRMQQQIDRVVSLGADVVALVCTGEFPEFGCEKLLIRPQKVLSHMVRSVADNMTVGVVIPDPDQVPQASVRWEGTGARIVVTYASPYADLVRLDEAARELRDAGVGLAVLDCIGFDFAMKKRFKDILGAPCVLARSALARVLRELLVPGA